MPTGLGPEDQNASIYKALRGINGGAGVLITYDQSDSALTAQVSETLTFLPSSFRS